MISFCMSDQYEPLICLTLTSFVVDGLLSRTAVLGLLRHNLLSRPRFLHGLLPGSLTGTCRLLSPECARSGGTELLLPFVVISLPFSLSPFLLSLSSSPSSSSWPSSLFFHTSFVLGVYPFSFSRVSTACDRGCPRRGSIHVRQIRLMSMKVSTCFVGRETQSRDGIEGIES